VELHFMGVGEACDGRQPNTSILLRTEAGEKGGRILLDCGFSVPHQYISMNTDPDELEILWISHFHGDHFFGTPLLLLWFWEMSRQKPLHIVGPYGIETKMKQTVELAYPDLMDRLDFPIFFLEIKPGERESISDTVWQAAYNEHSQPCLALRLEFRDKAIFYSGDGRPTPMTRSLAAGCDIIIHEAYGLEDTTPGHGSIKNCLDFATHAGVRHIALVHMQRNIRRQSEAALARLKKMFPQLIISLPEKGSTIRL